MKIVYAQEKIPESFSKAIFLAGPTPRSKDVASWRPEAVRLLKKTAYDGIVFYPEYRDGRRDDIKGNDYVNQIEWEEKCLNIADCIIFWIPRDLETMPAFTTNVEWGTWHNSGKVVFGAPKKAPKTRYQRYYAKKLQIPASYTLRGTIKAALKMINKKPRAQTSGLLFYACFFM